ncbi:nuclear pore complex protein NUP1-like isoform X2 [Prosopis cineraria]|uniref:nuclear pore complex protein NUP1-like isoform X2 n=1 Tax=Prosopis cineraria TaxID=364024 RepID=UPI00240F0995|nr:nuclear pore complex protein NUP1-like isoform X2 [Prosopis cineraria]
MSMEDSMAEDPIHSSSPLTPATPAFGQQPAPPQSNFGFGAPAPSGTSPFQFGTQQNIAPQSPTPFQASSSLEVNGTGSFSLGTGGGDKSGRRFVRVRKTRGRKKLPIFGSSTASIASTASTPMFGSSTSSIASTTSSPMFGSSPVSFTTSTPLFGSSLAASVNNDQMSMEDSMAEDPIHSSSPLTPATPAFGQQPAPPHSNFGFGAPAPSGTSPFQLGTQQNIAPQSPTPFQASSSLEVNGTGSFALGTGGSDKSGRRFVRVNKARGHKRFL